MGKLGQVEYENVIVEKNTFHCYRKKAAQLADAIQLRESAHVQPNEVYLKLDGNLMATAVSVRIQITGATNMNF